MAASAPVTVGIGVLCDARFEDGPCIIMAVDDKGSFGIDRLENNACGKFHDTLPAAPFAVAMSGTISVCDGVVSEFCTRIEHIKKKREEENDLPVLRNDDFRNAIKEARLDEYRAFLDEELQGYLGLTIDQWWKETNQEKRRKGFAVARCSRLYFPVWLIIGGFIGDKWVLMKASGATVIEMGAQCFATGVGEVEALQHLFSRKQEEYNSAPRTLLHVAEAMEKARLAYPKAIGIPADYMVLRGNKPMMRFPRSSAMLKQWREQFDGRSTEPMQSDAQFRKDFEKELYEYKSLNF